MILIIDDEELIRTRLKKILELDGYTTFTAADGREGLETFDAEHPRIVLLDLKMPGMDGIEVLKNIKQRENADETEVIMITGHGDIGSAIEAMKWGAFAYIPKPIDCDELEIELKKALNKLDMQRKLNKYVQQLEELAEERAKQLVHAERMATIGLLSAGIAHEINNPAMFISTNLRTLEQSWPVIRASLESARSRSPDDDIDIVIEDMPKITEGIKKGVVRIKKIVDSLKRYSSQQGKGEHKPVGIEECIDQALDLCHNRLKYNVEISRSRLDLSPLITCDAQQIEQVLVNLLINAADALEGQGKGTIEISTEKDNSMVRIAIADNGPGISEENLSNLFKPFFTTKEVGKGTGLGLAISQSIILEHGGTLSAGNRPQGGSVFTIELPKFDESLTSEK